jgi:hypothetical protein
LLTSSRLKRNNNCIMIQHNSIHRIDFVLGLHLVQVVLEIPEKLVVDLHIVRLCTRHFCDIGGRNSYKGILNQMSVIVFVRYLYHCLHTYISFVVRFDGCCRSVFDIVSGCFTVCIAVDCRCTGTQSTVNNDSKCHIRND